MSVVQVRPVLRLAVAVSLQPRVSSPVHGIWVCAQVAKRATDKAIGIYAKAVCCVAVCVEDDATGGRPEPHNAAAIAAGLLAGVAHDAHEQRVAAAARQPRNRQAYGE